MSANVTVFSFQNVSCSAIITSYCKFIMTPIPVYCDNKTFTIPVTTIHRPNVGSMLGQRRRQWPNIEPTLGRCIVHMFLRSIWLWAVPDIIIYNYHTLSSEPWNLFSSLYLYGLLVVSFPREWCHIQRWVVKIYTKIVGERLPPTLRRLKDKMHQLVYTVDYIVCAQSVTREDSNNMYLHDKPLKWWNV